MYLQRISWNSNKRGNIVKHGDIIRITGIDCEYYGKCNGKAKFNCEIGAEVMIVELSGHSIGFSSIGDMSEKSINRRGHCILKNLEYNKCDTSFEF